MRGRDLRVSQDTINSVATLAEGLAGMRGASKRLPPGGASSSSYNSFRQSTDTSASFSLAPAPEAVEVAAMYKVRGAETPVRVYSSTS
jgi:hypothetical protein